MNFLLSGLLRLLTRPLCLVGLHGRTVVWCNVEAGRLGEKKLGCARCRKRDLRLEHVLLGRPWPGGRL